MALILSVILIFVVLLISEVWWRRGRMNNELARKFVHITVGSFVAFWPYFLTASEIKLLSAAFLVGVIINRYFNVFRAIHSVQRPTRGEFWFALTVGILAFNLHQPHIFTAALLVMSLADGFAAIIGTRYGRRQLYHVFGSSKTLLGTLTFFVTCSLIIAGYYLLTPGLVFHPVTVLLISIGATFLENLAVRGLDNLLIPLFILVVLR